MARSVGWLLLLAAVLVGLHARMDGLGSRPVSHDEYYFARSVERIVDTGSVRFPSGGYYTRGILPQYLTAASWSVLGRNGFGSRLPILLLSLASLVAAFFYARPWVDPGMAALVAGALLVSSWHVEMGRFLRMYAAFQLATLLFLIAVHRVYLRGRWSLRYLPHVALGAAALCHELAVFLCPLLFLPYVLRVRAEAWPSRRAALRFASAGVLTTFAAVAWNWGAFYHLGVSGQYPEGYVPLFAPAIRLPAPPLWSLGAGDVLDLALVGILLAVVVAAFGALGALTETRSRPTLFLSFLLVAALVHQFAIVALLALVLVGRYGLDGIRRSGRAGAVLGVASLLAIAGWSVAAFILLGGRGEATVAAARRLFFALPDLSGTMALWWRYLPILAVILAFATAAVLAKRRHEPVGRLLSHPATLSVYIVLCLGTVQPRLPSLRYVFFVYPVLLTVLAIAVSDLAARWVPSRRGQGPLLAAATAFVLLFLISGDFRPAHLTNVPGPEATFCTGAFQELRSPQGPWFCRDDVVSPAWWLNRQPDASHGEPIIVAGQPTLSYYLELDHAHYLCRRSTLFDAHSREGGTLDLWSDRPLISTPGQAQQYLDGAGAAWLVRAERDATAFPEHFLFPDRLRSSETVFRGVDDRIEVIRLTLEP